MKRIHRLLLVWLLLLALPLQGYAGTHMLMCAAEIGAHGHPEAQQPAAHVPPCHAHAAAAAHAGIDKHAAGHDAAKPGSCSACSLLTAMATSALPPLGLDGPVSTAIPFHDPALPSVDPVLLERPPRVNAA